MASLLAEIRLAVTHPIRVIHGKAYSDFPVADHTSLREWLALGVLIIGLLVWASLVLGGLGWVVIQVVHRWL